MTGLLSRADFRCALAVPGLRGRGAVLLADIDQFVFLNAVLDHVVGDQMLQSIAEVVRSALPPGAKASRYGGNQFCIYVTHTGGAAALAEQLRASVDELFKAQRAEVRAGAERAGVVHPRASGLFTLSVGWAAVPLQGQPLEAIDLALAACSQAKAAGGNRVVGITPGLKADGED
jgi:diguanylate cyclase (GGDEF)-like protein